MGRLVLIGTARQARQVSFGFGQWRALGGFGRLLDLVIGQVWARLPPGAVVLSLPPQAAAPSSNNCRRQRVVDWELPLTLPHTPKINRHVRPFVDGLVTEKKRGLGRFADSFSDCSPVRKLWCPPYLPCTTFGPTAKLSDGTVTASQKMTMDCGICHRPHHPSRLPFLCAVDARNVCYEGRVQTLQVLLKNDELQRRISGSLAASNDEANGQSSSTGGSDGSLAKAAAEENTASQRSFSEDKTNQILARAEKLRLGIAAARDEIKTLSDANERRRSDLKSASNGIDVRRAKILDGVEKSIQTIRSQWNRGSDRMAATRGFLCMEAARLYGLRRVKKGSSKYEFRLGGIEVVDLASMNGMNSSPVQETFR